MANNSLVKTMGIGASVALSLLFWFIPSGSLFQTFMPRATCMFHDQRLITMHAIADSAIFIAYIIIAVCLFGVYHIVEEKSIPLKGFIWMFGIFILFCGFTHAIGVLNLFVTYYWLDGAIKTVCAIFSGLTAVKFITVPSILRDMYTGDEYRELMKKNAELEKRVSLLEKGTI